MIDGMSDQNGGTRIVPGSHLAGRHPNIYRDTNVKTIAAKGPPGCAVITDGRIWHGTGANRTHNERKAILITYCLQYLYDCVTLAHIIWYFFTNLRYKRKSIYG